MSRWFGRLIADMFFECLISVALENGSACSNSGSLLFFWISLVFLESVCAVADDETGGAVLAAFG